ncbi:cache domain-containing protein [Oxalobacteraceae bacterium]|nr:cache domain-containing protein [Oxalobacteraceae bacterium]
MDAAAARRHGAAAGSGADTPAAAPADADPGRRPGRGGGHRPGGAGGRRDAGAAAMSAALTLTGWALAGLELGALYWGYRRHVQPMRRTLALARRMAAGDISQPMTPDAAGGWGVMQQALNDIGARMFHVVGKVRVGMSAIATTSGFINADNAALSSRTESQASSLEQTAASMEQLTSTVRQNADNAQQADRLVATASASARSGGQVVQQVIGRMGAIRDCSRQIVDIITLIDSLAFQTNILALNAAVEAARAGEQGRGFAVVAAEVRALASRSGAAAAEIKKLIGATASEVEQGSVLVDAAGAAMDDIMARVGEVAAIMCEIAGASAEQSAGLDEISRAVTHIDGMTQQNATLVEEAARTSSGLHAQATLLADVVSGFSLGEREYGSASDAVQMVGMASDYAQQHGAAALLDDVKKLNNGKFVERDLYLVVYDQKATCVANGSNPRLVGVDGKVFKDADGKVFVAEIVAKARKLGKGWVDYKFPHPLSKQVQKKSTYFQVAGGLVISCGFYKR